MNNEQLNRKLHEAMGKCWHEDFDLGATCEVCGTHVDGANLLLQINYCGSISDAFELVEWMRKERDESFEISSRGGGWTVLIFPNSYAESAQVTHESLPMAIALAASRALEVGKEK